MSNEGESFNTMQVRPWDKPQLDNSIVLPVSANTLSFPLGLTWLDEDHSANIRINGTTSDATATNVKVNLNAWADTVLYSAGCIFLEVGANDRDFQCGTFNTQEDHPWDKPQTLTSRRIDFATPYAATPQVICWLNEFDIDKNHGWRCKTYVSNIDNKGFTIHVDTWADTILYSGGATWVAFPSNRPNIACGTYNVMDVRPWTDPKQVNSNTIKFDKTFQSVPRVFAALNEFDLDCRYNFRLKMSQTNVTTTGMTWTLESWGNTVMSSSGAAYIAIQEY